VIADFFRTYHWTAPTVQYDATRQAIYVTGVARDGMQQIGMFDLRNTTTRKWSLYAGPRDDHNNPSLSISDLQPIVAASSNHTADNDVRVYVGQSSFDVETLCRATPVTETATNASYSQILRRRTTGSTADLAILCRGGSSNSWSVFRRIGGTWDSDSRRLHAKPYQCFAQDGDTVWVVTFQHPVTSSTNDLRMYKINLDTGAVTNVAGTVAAGNLWSYTMPGDLTTALIGQSDMTLIRNIADTSYSFRTFDVSTSGDVLVGDFTQATPDATTTMDYKVLRHNGSGTWTEEALVNSGVSFGYFESMYVGGCSFGASRDEVLLCREAAGVWYFEQWTRSGDGTWAKAQEIATRSGATSKLVRPDYAAPGYAVVCELVQYEPDEYQDYYADLVLMPY
jgi:hypothetical protein